jgi:hypothetical protein
MRATTLNTYRLTADDGRAKLVRVLWVALATIALLVATQAPLAAQQHAVAIGPNARGVVRTNARYTIPEILILRDAAPATEPWQGTGYAEHVVRYAVAANVEWALAATQLPAGVEVLTETGEWIDAELATATGVTLVQGERGNGVEARVRVRVPEGTPATWAQELKVELRRR